MCVYNKGEREPVNIELQLEVTDWQLLFHGWQLITVAAIIIVAVRN